MELCHEGDVEEYLKRQPNEAVSPSAARMMLFQIAFALHAAAVRIHLKHYDVKLLNVFLQALQTKKKVAKHVVLRYGMGSNTFALRMDSNHALLVKLADYGTANVDPNSVGCAVTMAQFTTLENSPPEFMYLGDAARQGHSHDAYCLGLCMLHLFTGHAPYEEILGDVKCPPCFRKRLSKIWEDENSEGYSVLRDIILANVYKDENGDVVEGEPDETMYDTFYRYLVLFGVPTKVNMKNECGRVWRAVDETLLGCVKGQKRGRAPKMARDAELFEKHRATFSLSHGTNKFIARARTHLEVRADVPRFNCVCISYFDCLYIV
jgi:serine/threonine protein kinase